MFLLLTGSCKSYKEQDAERPELPTQGTIRISADESFKPVLDAQTAVFESWYPEAHIVMDYKPEVECLKDFLNDSVRMVITTRGYTPAEAAYIQDSLKITPKWNVVAHDAVAVIVHPSSADSLFTMNELKQILQGTSDFKLDPVFDGTEATSTVRFIVDSVLAGKKLSSKTTAAKSSAQVIDYVASTPGAIGFIGVSWIGNKEDSAQLSFLSKVKVARLESIDKPGSYVLPYQVNIYEKRYPMVRDLVYVLKEKIYRGLGYGFAAFLDKEIGQLVFKRAYLAPAHRNFILRTVQMREAPPGD